jgi:16S rRNA A1518/A1519 N6-dimethyltransferase RsmA/KsgA/DIM1 with predicted DNA glycosylase/AP lyase activity
VGNIPYNISGQLLFWMVDNYKHINKALLMVQKEVARRVSTIRPGTKDYGLTSVVMALFADTRILFDISPNCFYPVPKVTSSFMSLDFRQIDSKEGDRNSNVIKLAKSAFNQRRKMLRNSLVAYLSKYHPEISIELLSEYFEEKGLNNIFTKRSDEINVQDYLTISDFIESYRNRG